MSQYSSIRPLVGTMPVWVSDDLDRERLAAYDLYENLYWNDPSAYQLTLRGSEANKLLIPSAMTIVEACNRYLAKGWNFVADPRLGTGQEQADLTAWLTRLFRRERVWGKFLTQKRYGLIRGDQCWYLQADPTKPQGSRIRVLELDPRNYFPIDDPNDSTRVVGCHIAEVVLAADGKTECVKRQTYRKTDSGGISYELSWWQAGAWDDRVLAQGDLKPFTDAVPIPAAAYDLPPSIRALPVYHIANNRGSGLLYGNAEMRGMETLAAGLSQTISDEELALALAGLGLYVTTSGPPVDENGDETTWKIGPGYVAEIDPEADWKRVNGVTDVTPSLDHARFVQGSMREARGVPDVAVGQVDVQVAESGVALALKMAPILSSNAEKEQEMLGVFDQLLYDLATMWFPAYEGVSFGQAVPVSVVDDPLPVNRDAILKEIALLVDKGFITLEYGRQLLSEKLGYEFAESMGEQVVTEMAALAGARNTDPYLDRIGRELDNGATS